MRHAHAPGPAYGRGQGLRSADDGATHPRKDDANKVRTAGAEISWGPGLRAGLDSKPVVPTAPMTAAVSGTGPAAGPNPDDDRAAIRHRTGKRNRRHAERPEASPILRQRVGDRDALKAGHRDQACAWRGPRAGGSKARSAGDGRVPAESPTQSGEAHPGYNQAGWDLRNEGNQEHRGLSRKGGRAPGRRPQTRPATPDRNPKCNAADGPAGGWE